MPGSQTFFLQHGKHEMRSNNLYTLRIEKTIRCHFQLHSFRLFHGLNISVNQDPLNGLQSKFFPSSAMAAVEEVGAGLS